MPERRPRVAHDRTVPLLQAILNAIGLGNTFTSTFSGKFYENTDISYLTVAFGSMSSSFGTNALTLVSGDEFRMVTIDNGLDVIVEYSLDGSNAAGMLLPGTARTLNFWANGMLVRRDLEFRATGASTGTLYVSGFPVTLT